MLTLDNLKSMKPGIFAKGEVRDSVDGVNMSSTGEILKWVAVRGHIADWAIYIDNPYTPQPDYESVARMGDKVHAETNIKKLVPCDDAAFEMYRY